MRGALGIVVAAALGLAGCGGGGGEGSATGEPAGGGGPGPGGIGAPAFAGFDFGLATGDFWEYRWTSVVQTAQPGSTVREEEAGAFRVTLGPPVAIAGVNAFPLEVTGRSRVTDGTEFAPRWRYLAVADRQISGSIGGTSLVVLFDAQRGAWAGSGFFAEFPSDVLFTAAERIVDGEAFMTGPVLAVSRSTSESQCEIIGGIPICGGDESSTFIEREYYLAGIGPVGYFFHSSAASGTGGVMIQRDVGLVAASLRGDAATYVLEREPNDDSTTGQDVVLGTATATIRGDVSVGDAGAQRGLVVESGGRPVVVRRTIEDWFTFDLAGASTVTIALGFDDGGPAPNDVDLFVFDGTEATAPRIADTMDGGSSLALALGPGRYSVGVDAVGTPNGRVPYTLTIR